MKRFWAIGLALPLIILNSCSTTKPDAEAHAPASEGDIAQTQTPEAPPPPPIPDFVLGPGDEISVNVWRRDDLNRDVMVDPSGNIYLPLAGKMKASGMTLSALREDIVARLATYLVEPVVDISVGALKSQKVYVLGEVSSPGTLELTERIPVWEAISKTGGFTTDANEDNILLIRVDNGQAKATAVNLNLKKMLHDDGVFQNPYLQNGDIVYAPPRRIADVERFMARINAILSPIISIERGIVMVPQVLDAIQGKSPSEIVVP